MVLLAQAELPVDADDWICAPTITRCPRHITDWALLKAGAPRRKSTWRWAEHARARDIERYPVLPIWYPYPIPMEMVTGSFRHI